MNAVIKLRLIPTSSIIICSRLEDLTICEFQYFVKMSKTVHVIISPRVDTTVTTIDHGCVKERKTSGEATQLLLPPRGLFPHISPVVEQFLHAVATESLEYICPRQGLHVPQQDD